MKLTIRTRLIGGYAMMLTILIAMASLMTSKLKDSNRRLTDVVDVSARKINLSNELMIQVLQAARFEKNIILEKDMTGKERFRDDVYTALQNIDKITRELESLMDAEGMLALNDFKVSWKGYKDDLDKILILAMNNEDEKAFEISASKGLKVRDSAIVQLGLLITKNKEAMSAAKAENDISFNSGLTLLTALISVGILIALLISYLIIKSITGRIALITEEAEKIASRDVSGHRNENTINDELKPILNALESVSASFEEVTKNANEVASGDYSGNLKPRSGNDTLANALNKMTLSLREKTDANENHNWLAAGQNQLNLKLNGELSIGELSGESIGFLCTYLNASVGTVYHLNEKDNSLSLTGQYAYSASEKFNQRFAFDEGLIGQVATGKKQVSLMDVNEEYIKIASSVLSGAPKHLLITPVLFDGKTIGVIELGRLTVFNATEKEFISNSMESIAVVFNSANSRKKILELLSETQIQTEELQAQQEELRQMNEELEEQTQNLKQQQEELQMTNEELEQQAQSLEMRNAEVESAKNDIEKKTKQLEVSSKYKSEFLANMSHELRTPLNSLLILSKDLSENKKKNLDSIQVECAEIIYKSGNDLLVLINEVLDLSKIEAGKMAVNNESILISGFAADLVRNFNHIAEQKGVKLICEIDEHLPLAFTTDAQRLNQILKNLLSNAFKFTEKGSVTISFKRHSPTTVMISVTDTGIGIQDNKQMAIFEAFQQADGGTSRKYGGTGLGLSISRELAKLLGGEIQLSSKLNQGSVFSLIIPLESSDEKDLMKPASLNGNGSSNNAEFLNYLSINDDRNSISAGDKVVLIIEEDPEFAALLLGQAHQKGFKCICAATGEDGLQLASRFRPQAIMLDMALPGMSGDKVLLELNADPYVRQIPVHVISAKENTVNQLNDAAVSYLMKPVDKKALDAVFERIENFASRKIKNLLIVEDNEESRKAMSILIGKDDLNCFEAATGEQALIIYSQQEIDCIILDLGLPDINGFDLIKKLENTGGRTFPPLIVYTGRELTMEENNHLLKYAGSIIIKGVKSEERLLDETALFLHKTSINLPGAKSGAPVVFDKESIFSGKKVLVADDDQRNVFALSLILKDSGMEVIKAENGRIALEMLEMHPEIDLVLMDIMMPEMDGFEAMRKIRSVGKFRNLPVIALTAKAMKDDKQKCIDAGANDYVTKPINSDQLLSLMRVWLSK